MTTVMFHGREYHVKSMADEMAPYEIHGPRGARYRLYRTHYQPDLMFPVNERMKVIKGWLTDRDGVLREAS